MVILGSFAGGANRNAADCLTNEQQVSLAQGAESNAGVQVCQAQRKIGRLHDRLKGHLRVGTEQIGAEEVQVGIGEMDRHKERKALGMVMMEVAEQKRGFQ